MDSTRHHLRRIWLTALALGLACTRPRQYFVHSELPRLEKHPLLVVAPGPWKHEDVPVVLASADRVPDDLVLPTLKNLMKLPGAADACDPNTGRPRPDATEYCVAVYKTPEDWRASWPIRNLVGELGLCDPPFGGVEDEDFGRDLPVIGFAHNHPCGTSMSSQDLNVFPVMKAGEGSWMMVEYAVAPSGKPARDSRGNPIPAWAWLATGHVNEPLFYKWNLSGEVFRWSEPTKGWEFLATCVPQEPGTLSTTIPPPKCSPSVD